MYTSEPADDCAAGQICAPPSFGADPVCQPLCDAAVCHEDWVCAFGLCLPSCDPLGSDTCPASLHCAPESNQFLCQPTHAQAPGLAGLGEPCVGLGHCEHGYLCTPDGAGCDGESCCAPVCDEAAGVSCTDGQVCEPLFADPGQTIGVCV